MKRHLIFLLFALAFVFVANAQTSLIAVLSHDGEIQTFTGNKALINAYNAAKDGDVITLSPGQFDAVDINKSLTIRGGGMYGENVTIISGNMLVGNSSNTYSPKLIIEGLAFNSYLIANRSEISCIKCYINTFYDYNNNDVRLIHCDINETTNNMSLSDCTFVGCRVRLGNAINNCVAENCIFENHTTKNMWGRDNQYINCILEFDDTNCSTSNYRNSFIGCVYIGGASSDPMISSIPGENNRVMPKGTQYLKEGTTTFELLDELQTTWLGTDGKQVGMHGGSFPFDPTTTNPQIKKFDVSSKTSADGKLSVDIEVDIK